MNATACTACRGPVGLHRSECPTVSRWLSIRLVMRLSQAARSEVLTRRPSLRAIIPTALGGW